MIFQRLLGARPAKGAGRLLHAAAMAQARRPGLYADLGAPDTIEGRFEMVTLHVILLLERLGVEAGAAAEARQALFDTYVKDLDGALREMGVGDLSVGKKMRKLGEAFYGRAKSYRASFDALPNDAELRSVIGRTILAAAPGVDPGPLAAYAAACRDCLVTQPAEALVAGRIEWPPLS
jgi:cytochrome b pre-mRNA-processing protein 3